MHDCTEWTHEISTMPRSQACYYMAHPHEYLLDTLPRVWEDRAARILVVPVLSPFWTPVMLSTLNLWFFGLGKGTLVTLVRA